jgi:hypothetical protein
MPTRIATVESWAKVDYPGSVFRCVPRSTATVGMSRYG